MKDSTKIEYVDLKFCNVSEKAYYFKSSIFKKVICFLFGHRFLIKRKKVNQIFKTITLLDSSFNENRFITFTFTHDDFTRVNKNLEINLCDRCGPIETYKWFFEKKEITPLEGEDLELKKNEELIMEIIE